MVVTTFLLGLFLWQAPVAATPELGMKALDEGRYAEAARIFKELAAKSPEDIGTQFHLGLSLSLLGENEPAIAAYESALKLKPDLYEAHVNLGQVLLRAKRPAEAAKHLETALGIKPREPRPMLLLGDSLLQERKAAEAAVQYQALAELQPNNVDAWTGLARARAMENKPGEAADAIAKAVALDGTNQNLRLEQGVLLEAAGRKQEAMAAYRSVPEDAGAQERLGTLLLDAGDAPGAAQALEVAVSKSPTEANRYALAIAYLRNKQLEKATPLAEAIVGSNPGNLDVRLFYGRLLRDQKRYADAAKQFLVVAKAKPESLEVWNELSAALVLSGQTGPALASLEQVKKLGGETPAYHWLRAILLDGQKEYKLALESYQKFLAMSGGKNPDEEFKARGRIKFLEKAAR